LENESWDDEEIECGTRISRENGSKCGLAKEEKRERAVKVQKRRHKKRENPNESCDFELADSDDHTRFVDELRKQTG